MILKFIAQKANPQNDFVLICLDKYEIGESRDVRKLIGTVVPVLFTDKENLADAIKQLKDINLDKVAMDLEMLKKKEK